MRWLIFILFFVWCGCITRQVTFTTRCEYAANPDFPQRSPMLRRAELDLLANIWALPDGGVEIR